MEDLKSKNASEFSRSYDDIVDDFGNLTWVDDSLVPEMPNPMRKLVDDEEDLLVIMVSPWADDVSGNKSKQYNKHMKMYTGNGCLPGRLLQQEFHVHYISSSPHASSAEQFAAFRDHVKSTETNPVKAYNAATKRKCQFILRVPGLPADNPQQSEEASHMGSNANHPCRKCNWGGTGKEKETEKLYHECHLAGALRSVGDPDESPKAVAAGNAWKFEGNQGPAAANRNEGQDCAVLDRTVDLQIQGNQGRKPGTNQG
jgi:hypothetical protein